MAFSVNQNAGSRRGPPLGFSLRRHFHAFKKPCPSGSTGLHRTSVPRDRDTPPFSTVQDSFFSYALDTGPEGREQLCFCVYTGALTSLISMKETRGILPVSVLYPRASGKDESVSRSLSQSWALLA